MKLGDRLVHVRIDQGLEVKDFAEKLGVTAQTYHNWVSGKSQPDVKVIVRVLELFPNYNPLWLLLGDGEPNLRVLETVGEPNTPYADGWKSKVEMLVERMSEEIRTLRRDRDLQSKEIQRLGQEILGIRGIIDGD